MSKWPDDFQKYVLDDVQEYPKKNVPVKTNLLERLLVKNLPVKKMHANPIDEFTWDTVGPNFGIVSNYVEQASENHSLHRPAFSEPIIVEKMSPEGYMLVNGHHRWFAALRARIPKVLVTIVNLTHEEDILIALQKTNNHKSAAFDLDEVLFMEKNGFTEEPPVKRIGTKAIKERLRAGAAEVLKSLKAAGYDIWVYTSSYNSEKYISSIFNLYDLEIEGIINGIGRKQSNNTADLKKKINEKYKLRLHIDNESILCTYSDEQEPKMLDLSGNSEYWAKDVLTALEQLKE